MNLAISLHSPIESLRRELIPWAEHFELDDIFAAARYYFEKTGREITLEYILLAGVKVNRRRARPKAGAALQDPAGQHQSDPLQRSGRAAFFPSGGGRCFSFPGDFASGRDQRPCPPLPRARHRRRLRAAPPSRRRTPGGHQNRPDRYARRSPCLTCRDNSDARAVSRLSSCWWFSACS